jgi:hypothetical protein
VRPPRDLTPQRLRLVIGQPDRGQKAGREQLRQHLRVDLIGLHLCLGDRPRLRRVRDDHTTDVTLEQPRDRVRVTGRLERDLVLLAQAAGKQPQRLRCRLDPARRADDTLLPDRDLGKLAVHVESDTASHTPSFQPVVDVGAQAGKRHLRIRARSASGPVAAAATSLTRAHSPSSKNGLPDLRLLPDAPVPDGRTVLTSPDADGRLTGSWVAEGICRLSYGVPMRSKRSTASSGKMIKTKGHFPNEEAARKLIYLAISNATPAWTKTRSWT